MFEGLELAEGAWLGRKGRDGCAVLEFEGWDARGLGSKG